jgi:tetratricopeptide (TPR) repeat protein
MKGPSPERVAEFAAAARRIVVERTNAAEVVSQLLRDTPREEWLSLASRPELQTNGALERLSRAIDTALDRQPQDALPLSLLATTIADALPDDQYPAVVTAQIRAHAWKDRAQALTFNGKHEEAVDAIQLAERSLEPFGTVAHDRAVIWLMKGIIVQSLRQFDDARLLLAKAGRVFKAHHDHKRRISCGIAEAAVLYRQGHIEAARAVLQPLLGVAEQTADRPTLAVLHNNLGACLLELGEFTDANIHFSEAIARMNDLGKHIDALRTEMSTGRLLITKGQTAHGLVRLRNARHRFLENKLHEEAALCGLDIAAVLLNEDREREARQLVDDVLQDLRTGNLNDRGRAALEYLERELAAHDATPAVVRHATEYLLKSDHPGSEFVSM